MKLLQLSIKDNVLKYNGKKIVMKRKIIDYIIMLEYIIILEEYTGDDYDIVYCYSTYYNKMSWDWKIKKPDSKFIGKEQRQYVGLFISQGTGQRQGLAVCDSLGREFIIDMDTGEIVDRVDPYRASGKDI